MIQQITRDIRTQPQLHFIYTILEYVVHDRYLN